VAQPILLTSVSGPLNYSWQSHRLGCVVLYSLSRIRKTRAKVGSEGVVRLQKFTYRSVCSCIFVTDLCIRGDVSSILSLSRKSVAENSCVPWQAVMTDASILTVCQPSVP
jgi:hypothetical protein